MSQGERPAAPAGDTPTGRIPPLAGLHRRHALWFECALGFAMLAVVCLLMLSIDERTLNGVTVWAKPAKFSVSLALYFGTLAWFAPLMPKGYFATATGRWLSWIAVVCAVLEIIYITVQAALGEPSHFNVATPFSSTMYSLMGGGAFILVTVCLWVGGSASDADGLWLVHWSRDGGDLRVPHFFGMHAMQVLPALGALVAASTQRSRANATVLAMTLLYAAFASWTFRQAVSGIPFAG
jgi:hypothetical protein